MPALFQAFDTNREVTIYDYGDGNEPMLVKIAGRREA
jgi:hypothetical protein